MSRGSILIHTSDALGGNRVSEGLRDAGYETVLGNASASRDLIAARAVDLLLLDDRDPREFEPLITQARAQRISVVLLSANPEPSELLAKLSALGVCYLISVSGAELDVFRGVSHRELITTIDTVIERASSAHPMGPSITRHLPSADLQRFSLSTSADREAALDAISTYLDRTMVSAGLAATMALIADQLASNALRHGAAPIVLSFGCDDDVFAVSVRDSAGALSLAHLAHALSAPHSDRRGLLAAMHGSSQLVFHLAPGHSTEVVAFANLHLRPQMHPIVRSVHVFVDDQRRLEATAVPQTVELSESLRVDLRDQLAAMASGPHGLSRGTALEPRQLATPSPRLRRRPRATPNPLTDVHQTNIGIDTLRGILRGAAAQDVALESAIRFLAGHARAVLLYRRDGESLIPHMAAGLVARWHSLGQLEPWLRAPSTPSIVARDQSLRAFDPRKRGLDRRIVTTIGASPSAHSWALPIVVGDEVEYVLCAFNPAIDRVVVIRMLLDLRAELEDALVRLAAASLLGELYGYSGATTRPRRATTASPYAAMELLYPRALTGEDDRPFELDLQSL